MPCPTAPTTPPSPRRASGSPWAHRSRRDAWNGAILAKSVRRDLTEPFSGYSCPSGPRTWFAFGTGELSFALAPRPFPPIGTHFAEIRGRGGPGSSTARSAPRRDTPDLKLQGLRPRCTSHLFSPSPWTAGYYTSAPTEAAHVRHQFDNHSILLRNSIEAKSWFCIEHLAEVLSMIGRV